MQHGLRQRINIELALNNWDKNNLTMMSYNKTVMPDFLVYIPYDMYVDSSGCGYSCNDKYEFLVS